MTDPLPIRIAIYDLDRTVLRTPTFTLFLLWAAWREAAWRLLLLPALAALMIGYALRLYGRDRFKPASIRLMLGGAITPARAESLAAAFAAWRVPRDVPPGAAACIKRDRAEGYRLLMATAAPEFYAGAIADALGFDAIVASRHLRDSAGNWLPMLDGPNCYGDEKARRVAEWLAANAKDGTAHIRAYSDHVSDAPTFALASEAWLVGRGDKYVRLAAKYGWHAADFEDAAVAEVR
ncbi:MULTISPECIES: HAD-IB family phosphatase [unclassified Sphingopyxis]|jgi:HAD superfamily phosphoserine phosphatase-like hydrolase|uniref:HAD-IB family phosphatase n=1 Tax=unclassified Sphingopyxis TaxID=2614943 RepID=UPI0006C0B903|nr:MULTISPECIES: HAD-IB family phosphatase [unclassified Sphingopyxis]USI77535.1 HAD-IB family phosphatase [Sphingopyxis sp. USTB-05]GAO79977.1 phosphoserine phosphatase [Sphingopyxis sp. C-1]